MIGFIQGFMAPFRGGARLMSRPGLWPWALTPILLNAALCVGVAYAWFSWAAPLAEEWAVGAPDAAAGFFATAGRGLVRFVMFIAALPLLLGAYLALAGLLGGPFYEVLCAKTEAEELGGDADDPKRNLLVGLVAGVRVEAGNFLVAILGGVTALAATILLPVAGVFVATGLGWFLAGFGYLVYPFDRRALTLGAKLRIVFRRLDVALGFGCATYVLLLPIVTTPLVAPCAVVGAALLYPGAARRGENGSRPARTSARA